MNSSRDLIIPKLEKLSKVILELCEKIQYVEDLKSIGIQYQADTVALIIIYNNKSPKVLLKDKRLNHFLIHLCSELGLTKVHKVTYYIPSNKLVINCSLYRLYTDPESNSVELTNFEKGVKRTLPITSIKPQLELLDILFKESLNSLNEAKIEAQRPREKRNKDLFDSVNNVISIERTNAAIRSINNTMASPRIVDPISSLTALEASERELLDMEVLRNLYRDININRYPIAEPVVNNNRERIRHLEALIDSLEDTDATVTAIRFAENYL